MTFRPTTESQNRDKFRWLWDPRGLSTLQQEDIKYLNFSRQTFSDWVFHTEIK